MKTMDFDKAFATLTEGNPPFPWQQALYHEWFTTGKFPPSCNLPTGLGKTSVIAIWLIALANYPDKLPRRLVYVVNRRTVVDQTTNEVEKLRAGLRKGGLFEPLSRLCAIPLKDDDEPLAISTLRGQFADNREWSADPSRPAVIVGTVDLIGSRLLFSGYRIGFKSKPLHAGFLGQNVLLVHDEAHLEPAFQDLLIAIQEEQERCNEFGNFRVTELSATSRQGGEPFKLTDKDRSNPEVKKRIEAKKALHFHNNNDKNKLADQIVDLALEYKDGGRSILVFARTIENVNKIADKLRKAKQQVETLTGTMRGKERDELVEKPIFRRFLPKAETGHKTVYLICTSAGEVGVNISADHLVSDLTTFESMAQRFGRVNRFGDRNDTEIHVVHPVEFDEKGDYESRLKKTLDLLRQLEGDASPAAMDRLDPKARKTAFAPTPIILPVSDILFDTWALTTIRGKLPGRPRVEPYLHGLSSELPETYVAWREEVELLRNAGLSKKELGELLADYPLKPHELLRDRSDRVFKHIASLAEEHGEETVWLIDDDGELETVRLRELLEEKERINWLTVVLPPSVGGLAPTGMLGHGAPRQDLDVADESYEDSERTVRRRKRIWEDEERPVGMRLVRAIDTKPDADEAEEESAGRRVRHWYVRPKSADDDGSKTAREPIGWQHHTDDVVRNAEKIADALLRDHPDLHKALVLAARFHDLGKKRELWQRSIGNPKPTNWLSKSGGKMKPRELTDYRHEFGSLMDILDPKQRHVTEFQELSQEMQDVVLHLIAVHHGLGRPHFPTENAFDPNAKEQVAADVAVKAPRRFARLQRKYGRWGLSYLESLLRAADWAASAKPSSGVEGQS